MRQKKIHSGGFVLVEFAIALPLLVLVLYALGLVSVNIYKLGKDQLADYVLESEARYAMERITQAARTAKEIDADRGSNEIKIIYRAVKDLTDEKGTGYNHKQLPNDISPKYLLFMDRDVLETQIFGSHQPSGGNHMNLYAQRKDNEYNNPITGDNFFGDTQLISLKFSELNENVLRIELVMGSVVTGHTIKIATAVFMPGCDKKKGLQHE